MIKGIGIDIVETERIERIVNRQPRFPQRILSKNEHKVYSSLPTMRRKIEFLAGRFSAKEAFSKAQGTGIGQDYSFQSIEILPNEAGGPILFFKNEMLEEAFVSISHSQAYVVSQVVIQAQ